MIEPSAKAFRFVLDGQNQQYDAYIELMRVAGFPAYVECRYRHVGRTDDKWTFLVGPGLGAVDTTENTDASFDKAIDVINAKIKEVFNTAGNDIPLKGLDRVEWLIQVGIKELDNVVSHVS